MSSGGSSGSRQSSAPWAKQKPYLESLYKRADTLYNTAPLSFYPGATVAQRDPGTQSAINATLQRGLGGSPVTDAAQGLNLATTQGFFLGGPGQNPYLDQVYARGAQNLSDQFHRTVLPALQGRFGTAGRLNSGAESAALRSVSDSLGSALGDLALNTYSGNYEQERARQMQAASMAPGLAATDYQDLGAAQQAGLANEQYAQQLINELIARHEFGQNVPFERLNRFQNAVGNVVGTSQGTSSARQYPSLK